MSLIGVTAVEIAPALHLHYQPKWSIGRLCCCCGKDDPKHHEGDTLYYVNRKMKVELVNGHSGNDGQAASHARLKMVVIRALVPLTEHPFNNAERVFSYAKVGWSDPEPLYRSTLESIDRAFDRVKHELLNSPIELD